jgi:hypothetical protein
MRSSRIPVIAPTTFLAACADQSVLLNSERIERHFGNYGIELLPSEDGVRRSKLFSDSGEAATCRTYAVVEFADDLDPRIANAHQQIAAGSSIGTTLREQGWGILKQTLHIGEIHLPEGSNEVRRLMRIQGSSKIAVHAYRLVVADDDAELAYATILEAHHPEYLDVADLLDIYGPASGDSLSAAKLTQFTDLLFGR